MGQRNPCRPDQVTAYSDAAHTLEDAARVLEKLNIARLDPEERNRVFKLIEDARALRHDMFGRSYDRFIVDRYGE